MVRLILISRRISARKRMYDEWVYLSAGVLIEGVVRSLRRCCPTSHSQQKPPEEESSAQTYDPRSLYEKLQEQKQAKQAAFEEKTSIRKYQTRAGRPECQSGGKGQWAWTTKRRRPTRHVQSTDSRARTRPRCTPIGSLADLSKAINSGRSTTKRLPSSPTR